jgi:hypothetical protein
MGVDERLRPPNLASTNDPKPYGNSFVGFTTQRPTPDGVSRYCNLKCMAQLYA